MARGAPLARSATDPGPGEAQGVPTHGSPCPSSKHPCCPCGSVGPSTGTTVGREEPGWENTLVSHSCPRCFPGAGRTREPAMPRRKTDSHGPQQRLPLPPPPSPSIFSGLCSCLAALLQKPPCARAQQGRMQRSKGSALLHLNCGPSPHRAPAPGRLVHRG